MLTNSFMFRDFFIIVTRLFLAWTLCSVFNVALALCTVQTVNGLVCYCAALTCGLLAFSVFVHCLLRLMMMCAPLSGVVISNSLNPALALSREAALRTVWSGAKSVHATSTFSPFASVRRLSVAMIVVLRITSNAIFYCIYSFISIKFVTFVD